MLIAQLVSTTLPYRMVRVYLNTATDSEGRHIPMAIGYTPGDTLQHAMSFATTDLGTVEQIAETSFAAFNGHPESSDMAMLTDTWYTNRNRSLSVGDVVVVDGHAVAVASAGFLALPDFVAPNPAA